LYNPEREPVGLGGVGPGEFLGVEVISGEDVGAEGHCLFVFCPGVDPIDP